MDLLAGLIGLVAHIVGALALICLIKPLRALGMGSRARAGIGLGLACVLLIIAGSIASPGAPAQPPAPKSAPVAANEPEKPPNVTPAGKPVPSSDDQIVGFCTVEEKDQPFCEASRKDFESKYWPGAWAGDYQGQRNVSFCLSTGCDGSVKRNPVGGCAWRIVILASGSPKIDATDTMNFETFCGRLSDVEKVAAHAQSEQTFSAIYGRALPKGF